MALALGIDTGGTYTDAVLLDQESGEVLATAKALTTRRDLALGIEEVLGAVVRSARPVDIGLVGLSTTLATNAIVEGQGSPVCLLLIGYDRQLLHERGFADGLATGDLAHIAGGHDGTGNERAELDEAAVRRAVAECRGRVEAFAISGYFGVRNPAHEIRARQLVEQATVDWPDGPLPTTCGHELSAGLDSVRRATTAALNARLIPLLKELIATVRGALIARGIAAPLMVVRGDGSLVRAKWARRRPIETVLSGPAASVVGAWHLAGRRDAWVVDVGGTTTDIARLEEGRPRLSAEGARIGRWRTMVETVDVATVGLGGDSHVRLRSGAGRELAIGPGRVVPLSLLASEFPEVVGELRRQRAVLRGEELAGQFALGQGRSAAVDRRARALLARLDSRPHSLVQLCAEAAFGRLEMGPLERLEAGRLVLRAGFTPTDALRVLGRFDRWDAAAARLGAELLAEQLGLEPAALCERVAATVSDRLTEALV
ncbi:MAG: hydantoinase/oxoprolinase family protein, partial [Candidatus Latescibacteria bacterium]|nr:hydantoinase/oxoprolinase family protein [Candidatus Latescibacterota bacterium]